MLKVLMLNKEKRDITSNLDELKESIDALKKREEEIAAAIEEAETEEEKEVVEEEVENYEKEKEELLEKKAELEKKLTEIEEEIQALEAKAPVEDEEETKERSAKKVINRGIDIKMNKFETREQMRNRLAMPEVRSFYEELRGAMLEKRALDGIDLVIPEQVILSIQNKIGDYATIYNEVNRVKLNGTGRVVLNGGYGVAVWTEMCDALQEIALEGFTPVELDGFKLGGYITVCNALLEDSMIDLANYVEDRLAQAVAVALDKAILNGEGAAAKQPEGILTKVTKAEKATDILGTLQAIAKLDKGENGYQAEKVIGVMRRDTFYNRILPETYMPTADGRLVIGSVNNPVLPDGTRIVFSNHMPEDTAVFGDFKQGYLLGERKNVTLARSTEVKFIEEQTVFKISGRYDGKVIHKDMFVKVKFEDKAEPVATE